MPEYTCEKCGRIFQQKSHYQDHVEKKKKDCAETTALAPLVEEMKEIKKEIHEMKGSMKGELVLSSNPEERKKEIAAFIEDLHHLLWTRAGLSPEKALEHLTFFFAYRLIELQADVIGLPKECRWTYLPSLHSDSDIFETIKTGVAAFRSNSITKPFFKPHELQKVELVGDIVRLISRIPLYALQEADIIGDIFEHMLGRGMSTMADTGSYYTNPRVCRAVVRLGLRAGNGKIRCEDGTLCTVGDWYCGSGGLIAGFVKEVNASGTANWSKDCASIYCQDMNVAAVHMTRLNLLILTGMPFSGTHIRSGNSFADPITRGQNAPFPGLTLDYCFMNPPFGGDKKKKAYKFAYSKSTGKGKNKETHYLVNEDIQTIGIEDNDKASAGVQLGMATMTPNGGVCGIVLPHGFFFSKDYIELRKKIAEEYKIHYVVDVASGAFANTGAKTSILIFQRGVGATERVQFMDMDEKVLVEATLEELRAKNYSLNYKQYLPQSEVEVDGFEMVKLGDILDKKPSGKTKKGNMTNTGEYPFFSCTIINPCGTHSAYDHDEPEYLLFAKSGGNSKQPTGDNLGIGRFYYMTEKSASTSDVSKFVLKNSSASLKYVSLVLHTKLYQIQSLAKYTTGLGHIDIDQMFDEIQIPLPSLERQQEIVDSIDGFTQLAHAEEQSLKLLEKSVMFEVKWMGVGKERVKLGEVCSVKTGKYITKATSNPGIYPTYGGGDAGACISEYNRENEFMISKDGVSEKCVRYVSGKFFLNHHGWTIEPKDNATYPYIGYWLLSNQDKLYELAAGTGQIGINQDNFYSVEIPLPSLAEQQTLQSDFEEIRHKHAKIAEYKAKAQAAIQRLIPGAKAANAANTKAPSPQDVPHSSTCDVQEDGTGCTCHTMAIAASSPAVDEDAEDLPLVTASTASTATTSDTQATPIYAAMSNAALMALCKARKIRGYSGKKKEELVAMLKSA